MLFRGSATFETRAPIIDGIRHIPIIAKAWDHAEAETAIDEIVADALEHFDEGTFWPAHPSDATADGNTSVYFGAAGVIWALTYLRRQEATQRNFNFSPMLAHLLKRTQDEMSAMRDYAKTGSLLFGDLGTALVAMRIDPNKEFVRTIQARVEGNAFLPLRELMWGTAGSMLACFAMFEMTVDNLWRDLFVSQAERLLSELGASTLWTQDLYGRQRQFLGPVHGYAGNLIPLLRGWDWLTEAQRQHVADEAPRTLANYASWDHTRCNWPPEAGTDASLCQYCHGAPGMVTTFADAPFSSPDLEKMLLSGGELTWAAGPLAKGSNLCHGTGGNGYAFLKLYRRTQDALWLDRARAFAMTAIHQCREARAQFGRGRYSLWTGDTGLAVYLHDCIKAKPRFPTIDVF